MKFRKEIMIFSLVLLLLAISAVSADENIVNESDSHDFSDSIDETTNENQIKEIYYGDEVTFTIQLGPECCLPPSQSNYDTDDKSNNQDDFTDENQNEKYVIFTDSEGNSFPEYVFPEEILAHFGRELFILGDMSKDNSNLSVRGTLNIHDSYNNIIYQENIFLGPVNVKFNIDQETID